MPPFTWTEPRHTSDLSLYVRLSRMSSCRILVFLRIGVEWLTATRIIGIYRAPAIKTSPLLNPFA
jgi:hypothetical protein